MVGKRVKVKKADCISPKYIWKVGSGCFEHEEKHKEEEEYKLGEKVKLKMKECKASPTKYRWVVKAGCYKILHPPRAKSPPRHKEEEEKQKWKITTDKKKDCKSPKRWTPANKAKGIVKGFCEKPISPPKKIERKIERKIVSPKRSPKKMEISSFPDTIEISPRQIPKGKLPSWATAPVIPYRGSEDRLRYLQDTCTEDHDMILLMNWDEFEKEDLEDVFEKKRPDGKADCYQIDGLKGQLEAALQHNDIFKDVKTNKAFSKEDLQQIIGIIKRKDPSYKPPLRNYEVPLESLRLTKQNHRGRSFYQINLTRGFIPADITKEESGSERFTSKRAVSLLLGIYKQARMYKPLAYAGGAWKCCRAHLHAYIDKWFEGGQINLHYFKTIVSELESLYDDSDNVK